MSSDVYLDVCPNGRGMLHRCENCDVAGFGHLGTMHYFGFDLFSDWHAAGNAAAGCAIAIRALLDSPATGEGVSDE